MPPGVAGAACTARGCKTPGRLDGWRRRIPGGEAGAGEGDVEHLINGVVGGNQGDIGVVVHGQVPYNSLSALALKVLRAPPMPLGWA